MAAYLRVVPDEDMKVLEKYLDEEGVVLISQSTADNLANETHREAVRIVGDSGGRFEYDFGGEADVWVDIIKHDEHMALDNIARQSGLLDEDEYADEDGEDDE